MRLWEFSNNQISNIISVAELVRTRARNIDTESTMNLDAFLNMLGNTGLNIDYEGFKEIYDAYPELKNVIDGFDENEIKFTGDTQEIDINADDSEFDDNFDELESDIIDDEKINKNAASEFEDDEKPKEPYTQKWEISPEERVGQMAISALNKRR